MHSSQCIMCRGHAVELWVGISLVRQRIRYERPDSLLQHHMIQCRRIQRRPRLMKTQLITLRSALRTTDAGSIDAARIHLIDSVVHRTTFPPKTARSQWPELESETAGASPT